MGEGRKLYSFYCKGYGWDENRRKSHEETDWPTEEMAKESLSNLKIAERELDKMDEAIEMKLLDIQYSIDMRDCFKSLIN